MGRWDIDPGGVRGVLSKTQAAYEPLAEQAEDYLTSLKAAATATGSQIVAQALVGFATHHGATLTGIAQRTSRCFQGAVNATNAYLRGDEEMAARAQRNAVASVHQPPSWGGR